MLQHWCGLTALSQLPVNALWTTGLLWAIILLMQNLALLSWIIACVASVACGKALQADGRDAGGDRAPTDCACVPDASDVDLQAMATEAGTATGGGPGTGGVPGVGGSTGTGGAVGTGSAPVAGGASGSSGPSGSGGALATGGVPGNGGALATGGNTTRYDGGSYADCANVAGPWLVNGSCRGPHASFNGSFVAEMSQTDCKLTFTQTDDNTSTRWISNGLVENTGRGYLKGDFGFTDSSMCDLTVTADGWDMTCGSATQTCKLEARRIPDLY